jgi:hypothetical protein
MIVLYVFAAYIIIATIITWVLFRSPKIREKGKFHCIYSEVSPGHIICISLLWPVFAVIFIAGSPIWIPCLIVWFIISIVEPKVSRFMKYEHESTKLPEHPYRD